MWEESEENLPTPGKFPRALMPARHAKPSFKFLCNETALAQIYEIAKRGL